MIHVVEESLYVKLNATLASPLFLDLLKRRMARPSWSESMRMLGENWLIDSFQDYSANFL
jgi:hypothetical protein